jgi:adenosylhomocysteine nucleosidase
MPEEIAPFKQRIQVEQEGQIGAIQFWQGQYEGKQITLVQSGMGKVQAAAATQMLINQFAPDAIFSCGTAGSLEPSYQIGDIIVGERTMQHDYGFLLPGTFVPFGFQMQINKKAKFLKEFSADSYLLNLAKSVGDHWEDQSRIRYGLVLTGDQVILASEKRQVLADQFGATAVDMESAAMAQIACLSNVPFLTVRGISDFANETFPIDFSKLDPNEYGAFASASPGEKIKLLVKAISYFAQHPSKFALSLQARQNIKKAAQNSALFTLNLLTAMKL